LKAIILYNLYPKHNWEKLTKKLFATVKHQEIYICVSLDFWDRAFNKKRITSILKSIPKVKEIFFVTNNKNLGEFSGFEMMRGSVDFNEVDVVTYIHSKGVTKSKNAFVADWIELMRYFILERHDLCLDSFEKGFLLYGVNLGFNNKEDVPYGPFRFSDFHYSGNFISVNLNILREKFINTQCDMDYFGVEGFWGKLCSSEKAFCAHLSSINIKNHYTEPYPEKFYKKEM
jgi:hypothetical protein